ncbi:MAG: hypothetical protein K2Y22_09630 [Candidatus Obscuribacterales bacterium]|nr:hypothetical protein [Candidatus Obscuribacterales bacterium]
MKARKSLGNTLAILAVIVGVIVLLVAFFMMNYGQMIGTHKEAQTAIDATALQVAKDISRVVIGPADGAQMGYVALVDQVPKNNDLNQPPIAGINTLMATARLDALIADKMENTTMQVLAIHDWERVKRDSRLLRSKIIAAVKNGETVKDKNGEAINIQANAVIAYDSNAVKMSHGKRASGITILLGNYKDRSGMTNIPVPEPESMAQVDASNSMKVGNRVCYRPYVPVQTKVGKNNLTYMFSAVASEPTLVHDSDFAEDGGSNDYLIPTLVQVSTNETVNRVAASEPSASQAIHAVSTAIAGSVRQSFPSGAMQVSMPGGQPPKGYVDTSSVKTIMNHSQIVVKSIPQGKNADKANADTIGGVSPYEGWNAASVGTYFKATADFPGSGVLEPTNFRGRSNDDPSVILSFYVYDWLHNMYLRPNIESTVNTLSASLWDSGKAAVSYHGDFCLPAMADSGELLPVTFGIFNVSTTGKGDPRDLNQFNQDPEAYRRQFANVFGYVAADMTLPNQSLVVAMDKNARVVTTNGQPAEILLDLWQAIVTMNDVSAKTYQLAYETLIDKVGEIDKLEKSGQKSSQEYQKALSQARRAFTAMTNAGFAANLSISMMNDRKAITSLGVTKNSAKDYSIVGGHFYPLDRVPTKAEILGDQPISNGQSADSGTSDWLTPLNSEGGSALKIVVEGKIVVSHRIEHGTELLQPAMAATTVPQSSKNIFVFTVNGDSSKFADQGQISMTKPLINPADVMLKKDQIMYQNLSSLVTTTDGSNLKLVWNCVARDNGSNFTGSYFSDKQPPADPSTKAMPATISDWSLRCPAPTSKPPGETPPGETPPGETPPETPTCKEKPIVAIHSQADFDNKKGATDMDFVTVKADSAGNLTYYFKGQPMHFLTGDAWLSAVKRSQPGASRNVIGSTGPLIYNRTQGAEVVARFNDSQWRNWIVNHDLITNSSQKARYTGPTVLGDWKYSAYSQVVFELLDEYSCPQLYRWSS